MRGKKYFFFGYPTFGLQRGVLPETSFFTKLFFMLQRITHIALCLLLTIGMVSCIKNPVIDGNGYLQVSNATLHVANKQGASNWVLVTSNLDWQMTVDGPAPDWMVMNKTTGHGNDTLRVTTTKANNTGGYRFAKLVAAPVNNSVVLPVRVTVVQYDSTYKGN